MINKRDLIILGLCFCILAGAFTTAAIEIREQYIYCNSMNLTATFDFKTGVLCDGKTLIRQEDGFIIKPDLNITKYLGDKNETNL